MGFGLKGGVFDVVVFDGNVAGIENTNFHLDLETATTPNGEEVKNASEAGDATVSNRATMENRPRRLPKKTSTQNPIADFGIKIASDKEIGLC